MVDQTANLAWGTVLTPPTPTDSGTTLVLTAGHGSRFPSPVGANYNVIIKAAGERPLASNTEIVRFTAKSSDTFTISREQEGTVAREIQAGDEVYIAWTKKSRDDIQTEIDAADSAAADAQTDADTANASIATHIADTSTHGVSGAVVGTTDTQTLTNKTLDVDSNTVSNMEVENFKASAVVLESEGISSNDNDTTLPTSAAVKDYVDTAVAASAAPAFHADRNGSNQSFTASTYTKIQHNNEVFDTNSNYDAATNYRFTPTVAGKYLVIAQNKLTTASDQKYLYSMIYKNGTEFLTGELQMSGNNTVTCAVVGLVDMNGTSDYLEHYIWSDVTTPTINGGTKFTFFQAFKIG